MRSVRRGGAMEARGNGPDLIPVGRRPRLAAEMKTAEQGLKACAQTRA